MICPWQKSCVRNTVTYINHGSPDQQWWFTSLIDNVYIAIKLNILQVTQNAKMYCPAKKPPHPQCIGVQVQYHHNHAVQASYYHRTYIILTLFWRKESSPYPLPRQPVLNGIYFIKTVRASETFRNFKGVTVTKLPSVNMPSPPRTCFPLSWHISFSLPGRSTFHEDCWWPRRSRPFSVLTPCFATLLCVSVCFLTLGCVNFSFFSLPS